MEINYLKLYEVIIKYYPLGVNPFDDLYNQYSGSILLQDIGYEKLQPAVYGKWKTLVKQLKEEDNMILSCDFESLIPYPCYCGKLRLYKEKKGSMLYTRELNFHLSLIGNFYTIYGLDKVQLNSGTTESISFDPILYYSPHSIYAKYFDSVRNKILENYADYKFIPFKILSRRPEFLQVSGAKVKNGQNASIFQALFTFEDVTNYVARGDVWYDQ